MNVYKLTFFLNKEINKYHKIYFKFNFKKKLHFNFQKILQNFVIINTDF